MTAGFINGGVQAASLSRTASFTPTIVGSGVPGTASYSTQIGQYVRMADLVWIAIRIVYSAGTGTGTLRIDGLPFAVANNASEFQIIPALVGNIPFGTGDTCPACSLPAGVSYIQMISLQDNAVAENIPYDGAGQIVLAGFYRTDAA